MNRLRLFITTTVFTAILLTSAIPLQAQSMGTSGGHDLDQLWAQAQKQFDPSENDAVLLLEGRHVTIRANGDRVTRIHRVVWIGTARGIRENADLRIPHNSATSTLTVLALRTWRENVWWPSDTEVSPTAVVETLPYAVALADDYTTLRETMLLHDGVELPCIMETVYEIEDRGAATVGTDGTWIFLQRDPAALVELTVNVPVDIELKFRSANGAPDPESIQGAERTTTYNWTMENVAPLGTPRVADPASYAPYVSWSTWRDWQTLGQTVISSFDGAALLGDELADTLAARLKHELTSASKARAIMKFVDESTRSIHTDSRFWLFSPRPASRTWETAYGHGLDRAVLAASLFRTAGLSAEPVFRSIGSTIIPETPGLARFEHMGVLVYGDQLQVFYDPVEGTLTEDLRPFYGRVAWKPASEDSPTAGPVSEDDRIASRFELVATLEPTEDGGWSGSGLLSAGGVFCPYGEMAGLGGESLALIRKIASSVLPGATVEGFNPETFERDLVVVGFDLKLSTPEPDDHDRTGVVVGDPAGGIMAGIPSDVHLYNERRGSPVVLPDDMFQRVTLRIKLGDREVVYLPEAHVLENEIGRYKVNASEQNGWVTIDCKLSLASTFIQPASWPDLRALLLEDSDAANRTVLYK